MSVALLRAPAWPGGSGLFMPLADSRTRSSSGPFLLSQRRIVELVAAAAPVWHETVHECSKAVAVIACKKQLNRYCREDDY